MTYSLLNSLDICLNCNTGMDLSAELSLEPDSKIMTTLFLNVSSSFCGKGIASKLATKAEELAKEMGAVAVQVNY